MAMVKALRPKKDLYDSTVMDDRGGRPIMVASVIANNVALDLLGDVLDLHTMQWMQCTVCDEHGYVRPGSSLMEMVANMRPTDQHTFSIRRYRDSRGPSFVGIYLEFMGCIFCWSFVFFLNDFESP